MASDDAINLTKMQPPSYSKGDVFVIYGLINPTLVIPKSTVIHLTVINLDNDMNHNLVVSSVDPPYPYMAMMSAMNGMMMSSNSQAGVNTGSSPVMMTPFLPPTNKGLAHEYSYSLPLNQLGNMWYLCAYPGHAQDGMYGRIVVTG